MCIVGEQEPKSKGLAAGASLSDSTASQTKSGFNLRRAVYVLDALHRIEVMLNSV